MTVKIGVLEDRRTYAKDLSELVSMELADCQISCFFDVTSAVMALNSEIDWDIWVVDLMMSPGNTAPAAETDNGLATGTWFIKYMAQLGIKVRYGIIVLTSRRADDDDFPADYAPIKLLQKSEVTQVDVAETVRSIVQLD
jgi:hypothetical protein